MLKKVVTDFACNVKKNAEATLEAAEQTATDAKDRVGTAYETAEGAVRDAIDTGVASAGKAYVGVVGTVQAFTLAGIAVAFVVSPVPTIVGVAMLWLMESGLKDLKGDIDREVSQNIENRAKDRAVKILKKYGQVPKTAIVENDLVSLRIDAELSEVDGVIRKGEFRDRRLSELRSDTVERLIECSPDNETKTLLQAYKSYRDKSTR